MHTPRVVLAGAGHAHLYLAARAREYRRAGAELLLIDPGAFWYSGMATGLISGRYTPQDDQVDARRLMAAAGGQFIGDQVEAIDRSDASVRLRSGGLLQYDLLSLNLGSSCGPLPYVPGPDDYPVKPIANLLQLRERIIAERPARVAVIGAGATGCEIACNLQQLLNDHEQEGQVHLLCSGALPAPELPEAARLALADYLQDAGIIVHTETSISACTEQGLVAGDTALGWFSLRAIATGLQATALAQSPDLEFSVKRGFEVGATLQTSADPHIFAAGDCAGLAGHNLPRIGVFGVRQAPVLHRNLLASLGGKELSVYRPQKQYLSILNLGFGQALAVRGRLWWLGRASMAWKEWLDRRFVRRYQV